MLLTFGLSRMSLEGKYFYITNYLSTFLCLCRILVGLRWWSKINANGKEEWVFASINKSDPNKNDARVFWFFQYLMSVVWTVFAVISLLGFSISNLTVCSVGMVLTVTNTVGYIKCDKQHQKSMGHFIMRKAKDNMSTEQMTKAGLYAA